MNVWNRTNKAVIDHINGTQVIVPPNGAADLSDRKAMEMLKRHPAELSRMAPGSYTLEQEESVRGWPLARVAEFAVRLMRGELPAVQTEDGTEKDKKSPKLGLK